MNRAKSLAAVTLPSLLSFAQSPASTRAQALVKQAVAFAKQNGLAKLIEETTTPRGRFHVNREDALHIFIYDGRGMAKAFGDQTGPAAAKSRWDRRDPDAVMILQKLQRVAKNQESGWVDYKYANPATNLLDQRASYFEFYEGHLIGCGIEKAGD